ncbi:MAG: 3-phosphoshikimate 1-carboxyvinyltransferase [Acetivibrio sp.]
MFLKKSTALKGTIKVPGDKSISHRAIMLGSLGKGPTEISNFLQGADCLSTISCFQKLGVQIENRGNVVQIQGLGLHGLKSPQGVLDVGNSGTTARLLSGILAGQKFCSTINGDASIQQRPMNRIIEPLSQMGSRLKSLSKKDCAPLRIFPSSLHGISYSSPVASAQIKSCILFAGLYADGITQVTEPYLSRNHTELMFRYFGIPLEAQETRVQLSCAKPFSGQKVVVPGDISSAAYFMAAAAIVPNSEICIQKVGINPTRDGILEVMKEMGAHITLENIGFISGEPVADVIVQSSSLRGVTIGGSLIPRLIDELPILAVLAAYAEGETIIRDAQELKVKESNRIDSMVYNLSLMGAQVEATEDGMIIHGGKPLKGAFLPVKGDHRIAMSFAIAALAAEGETTLDNYDCVTISYPDFYRDLKSLQDCTPAG